MALLTLQDIGKIYVSEGSVAVGIRGVNLSFDRGEFVAVTGKSGSGKSTLLNVISGMDTYEEGELLIEGETTSHYLQPEWEEYRSKYISFIFQDYNIIDSFTVLENVELALMHIDDKRERRRRAVELINRVGLTSHMKHKGSKLSGGQKQRTVIARALAKDSPIILADEPTGNLDSATSREIIELLREVSRDKLLIVVTHNFDEVEEYATRHVRVFDGAVESDTILRRREDGQVTEQLPRVEKTAGQKRRSDLKNGIRLGRSIFAAKPRLSIFLCFLMIIGTLGVFTVTTLCGEATDVFEPTYMFTPIDGRLVVTTQNGRVPSEDEIRTLSEKYGAKSYLRFDKLLDANRYQLYAEIPGEGALDEYLYVYPEITFGEDFGDDIIGRYPESAGEVFLYLPISNATLLGKDAILRDTLIMGKAQYKICGVKYFYDNNLPARALFTEDGFRTATAIYYLMNNNGSVSASVEVKSGDSVIDTMHFYDITPSFTVKDGKVYINSEYYNSLKTTLKENEFSLNLSLSAVYYNYDYYYGGDGSSITFVHNFEESDITDVKPEIKQYGYHSGGSRDSLIISDELVVKIAEAVLDKSYKQFSLFFEDNAAAESAIDGLKNEGFVAVLSDTTYTPDAEETILGLLGAVALGFAWLISLVFLAFFINLCSGRVLGAFKSDMAIMRSMGIPVRVIRVGMYTRMMLSLLPSFVLLGAVATLIFTSPGLNEIFVYLYAWQYALIGFGMILLTVLTTRRQVRRLFGESVKKSLKGGVA